MMKIGFKKGTIVPRVLLYVTRVLPLLLIGCVTTVAYGMQEEVRTYACSVCRNYPEKIFKVAWTLSAHGAHQLDGQTYTKAQTLDDVYCCKNDVTELGVSEQAVQAFKNECSSEYPFATWHERFPEIESKSTVIDNPVVQKAKWDLFIGFLTNKYTWVAVIVSCLAAKIYKDRSTNNADVQDTGEQHTDDEQATKNR